MAVPTEEATRQLDQQQTELLRKIIRLILDDRVYTLTVHGIISPLNGKPIVSKTLLEAAILRDL